MKLSDTNLVIRDATGKVIAKEPFEEGGTFGQEFPEFIESMI
ncbi:MAG: hypothetical protein OXU23_16670 [Candidatus Poribacteria bacterium]|nr:hypothetical protein [Candidatus Poribacteria bacterium]